MAITRTATVIALGAAQKLAWASSYYLPAVLAAPMAREIGTTTPMIFAAFSLALVISALIGPYSGRAIDRWGGRPVLMGTSIIFAIGLGVLGLSRDVWWMFAGWAILGIAMGSGLYEGAFAALVRLYGTSSRGPITGITLLAGFASTVGWPLSAALEASFDWRTACFAWALLHVLVGLLLNWRIPQAPPVQIAAVTKRTEGEVPLRAAALLSFVFAATWFVSTAMAAHLPQMLQAAGATPAAAIAVGALIGPSQVAARLLEFGLLRRRHPLLSARLAAAAHPFGAALLAIVRPVAAPVFAVLHGAGNGILTIAKGTLPLAIFGPQGYGRRQGVLMVPARLAQALAPRLFGLVLERWGFGAVSLTAAISLASVAALLMLSAHTPLRYKDCSQKTSLRDP
jgi:MFS family permease